MILCKQYNISIYFNVQFVSSYNKDKKDACGITMIQHIPHAFKNKKYVNTSFVLTLKIDAQFLNIFKVKLFILRHSNIHEKKLIIAHFGYLI